MSRLEHATEIAYLGLAGAANPVPEGERVARGLNHLVRRRKSGGPTVFEKIKEEIKQDYYVQNFPNDGQRFVAWYLRNVHLRDQNEAKADITDGAEDKQIDAIFVDDDNSTIYVVQGKFVGADTIDAEPLLRAVFFKRDYKPENVHALSFWMKEDRGDEAHAQ